MGNCDTAFTMSRRAIDSTTPLAGVGPVNRAERRSTPNKPLETDARHLTPPCPGAAQRQRVAMQTCSPADKIILYGHHESGHSFKVALALALGGITYAFRWVDLEVPPEMRPSDVRAACRFGEVPALVDRGQPMVQSNAILLYLAHEYRCLGGARDDTYALAREWLFWEANRVGFALANLRHLLRFEPQAATPDILAWLRQRLLPDLAYLDAALHTKPYLLGDAVSIADVACSAYLFFAEEARLDLTPWPAVTRWLGRVQGLPNWKSPAELMPPPTTKVDA